jgi:16S rRNA (guanine527-N7)-methyltransferase
LERAQRLGFIGPGPVEDHLRHAEGFLVVEAPTRALDLGSGGGLPGLALAASWPASHWTLLDANQRRIAFLEQAVDELDLRSRVSVRAERAEQAAHDPGLRHGFDLVVSRGFGPPAVTAECAAGFLQVGGVLLVSEPPAPSPDRWPRDGLEGLGMADEGVRGSVRLLRQQRLAGDSVPRRVGVPAKRLLW